METATIAYRSADTSVALVDSTVGDALRAAVADASDRIAVVEGAADPGDRRTLTYAELLTSAERVARALLSRFRKGEHVAVWASNSLEWIQLAYGASMAGLVLVTVNPAYQAAELKYVLRQSRSCGVFHMASFRGNPMSPMVAEVRPDLPDLREVVSFDEWTEFLSWLDDRVTLPEVSPFDDVQIQYTSGTTGSPKGVLLRHRSVVNNAGFLMRRMGGGPGDVVVWPFPLFHTGGCVIGLLGALVARATLVCMTHFDPGLQLELIETYRATLTGGVPTMIIALLGSPPRDVSSLRVVFAAGSPMPVEVARDCERRFGVRLAIGYGTTECSPGISMTTLGDPEEVRTGTLGTALPHVEVMIVDPVGGEPVPVHTVGELRTRGYHVMHEYFDNLAATAAVIDPDGWYHTGDLASMDADGHLRIEGRLTDTIIRGGENIYPREIEDVLHRHPAVTEVAVLGRPDPTWGETVAAFVRTTRGATVTGDELHAYCRAHVAAYKTPATWIFVDAFPLTTSGKIRKNVLRESLAAEVEAYASAVPPALVVRVATPADLPVLHQIADRAVHELLAEYYTARQLQAARDAAVYEVEAGLIEAGTYWVAELDGVVVAGGGYGADGATRPGGATDDVSVRTAGLAALRAVYVEPGWARFGIGTLLARTAETAACLAGFRRLEALCTPVGESVLLAMAYRFVEHIEVPLVEDVTIRVARMRKEKSDHHGDR